MTLSPSESLFLRPCDKAFFEIQTLILDTQNSDDHFTEDMSVFLQKKAREYSLSCTSAKDILVVLDKEYKDHAQYSSYIQQRLTLYTSKDTIAEELQQNLDIS